MPAWSAPRNVALLLLGYLLLHFALRLAMWSTLGMDDAEQALFAQHWAWSYRYRAPPLFTWLLLPLSDLVGLNIAAISLLRYALLGVALGFTYLTARRLIADPRLSALSLYSFAAIYVFAYYSHHDLTHTTMMAAWIAVAWYVFVRLCEEPTLGRYLMLGATFGFGMLGKWNFVMLAAALPLACLLRPTYRPLVLTWKILPAGLVTAAITLPSVLWVLRLGAAPGDSAEAVLGSETVGFPGVLGTGTAELVKAVLAYPQPFLILLLPCFAAALWRGFRTRQPASGVTAARPRPDAELIGLVMLIAVALHWLLVPLAGATDFAERWMQPALMILPVYLFMLIERGRPSDRAVPAFALLMGLVTLVALGARVVTYALGADHCKSCRNMIAYWDLADQLRAAGFQGEGTILADGFPTGGNMRVQFPRARAMYPGYPPPWWPAAKGNGQCVLLWEVKEDGGTPRRDALLAYLGRHLQGDPDAPHREGELSALMYGSETRHFRMGYRLYDEPVGDCR